jgi:hypothetical protein
MMKKLSPKLYGEKAYTLFISKEAPELKKLPPLATPKLSQ